VGATGIIFFIGGVVGGSLGGVFTLWVSQYHPQKLPPQILIFEKKDPQGEKKEKKKQ